MAEWNTDLSGWSWNLGDFRLFEGRHGWFIRTRDGSSTMEYFRMPLNWEPVHVGGEQ